MDNRDHGSVPVYEKIYEKHSRHHGNVSHACTAGHETTFITVIVQCIRYSCCFATSNPRVVASGGLEWSITETSKEHRLCSTRRRTIARAVGVHLQRSRKRKKEHQQDRGDPRTAPHSGSDFRDRRNRRAPSSRPAPSPHRFSRAPRSDESARIKGARDTRRALRRLSGRVLFPCRASSASCMHGRATPLVDSEGRVQPTKIIKFERAVGWPPKLTSTWPESPPPRGVFSVYAPINAPHAAFSRSWGVDVHRCRQPLCRVRPNARAIAARWCAVLFSEFVSSRLTLSCSLRSTRNNLQLEQEHSEPRFRLSSGRRTATKSAHPSPCPTVCNVV